MSHLVLMPVLVPLFVGAGLLLLSFLGRSTERTLSILSIGSLLPIAIAIYLQVTDGGHLVYYTGAWPAPYGIVLVADPLSAIMLALTAVLALGVAGYCCGGEEDAGHRFHALLQFQLVGINGAFLTGDLFNLFVCFELLLIASYALLAQRPSAERTRAGLHVVALNLAGSALFLFAVGLIYAGAGTLNLADLAERVPRLEGTASTLVGAGGVLLLIVFALKAAIVPFGFWLVPAYAAAIAPVAALFAIMTKVGIYAILRVHGLLFGLDAGPGEMVLADWLLPAALLTLAAGTIGVVGARALAPLVAALVVISAGTLLLGLAIGTADAVAATVYYLIGSTIVSGALFLLAGAIRDGRGDAADAFDRSAAVPRAALVGALFFGGAVAIAGLPPLAGFAGKVWLAKTANAAGLGTIVIPALLLVTVAVALALARAGSALFWRTGDAPPPGTPASDTALLSVGWLAAFGVGLIVLAYPVSEMAVKAAVVALDREAYAGAVLANDATLWQAPASSGGRP